jgi:hypothetical protein
MATVTLQQTNLIDFVTSGLQGKPSRYDLTLNDDGLTVVDKATGDVIPVTRAKDKWRIATDSKAKYRYFTPEQVEKALLRKRLEAIPKKELDRRNNVEAAMFQISYHTRSNKTRYRGLVKHVMWACSRCLWINFIRLMIFQTTTCQRTIFTPFQGSWEVYAEPFDSYRRISAQPFFIFLATSRLNSERFKLL